MPGWIFKGGLRLLKVRFPDEVRLISTKDIERGKEEIEERLALGALTYYRQESRSVDGRLRSRSDGRIRHAPEIGDETPFHVGVYPLHSIYLETVFLHVFIEN